MLHTAPLQRKSMRAVSQRVELAVKFVFVTRCDGHEPLLGMAVRVSGRGGIVEGHLRKLGFLEKARASRGGEKHNERVSLRAVPCIACETPRTDDFYT